MKSWTLTCSGCPAGRHSCAAVLVGADQFLLLGVHADHRVTRGQVLAGLVVDVGELGVAVGVLAALDGLGVGLQAETLFAQQPGHGVRRRPGDRPRSAQRPACGSTASSSTAAIPGLRAGSAPPAPAARRPTPDRSRSPSCGHRRRGAPVPAAPPRPPARPRPGDPRPRRPRAPGHRGDAAVAQRPRLAGHHQPLLTLVQMRQHRLELRPQRRHHVRIDRHYHIMMYRIQNNAVIYRRAPSSRARRSRPSRPR